MVGVHKTVTEKEDTLIVSQPKHFAPLLVYEKWLIGWGLLDIKKLEPCGNENPSKKKPALGSIFYIFLLKINNNISVNSVNNIISAGNISVNSVKLKENNT